MSRQFLMTWDEARKRWTKYHRGLDGKYHNITVSCHQLGCSDRTKMGSYQAANKWWLEKLETLKPQKCKPTEASAILAEIMKSVSPRELALIGERGDEARKLLSILQTEGYKASANSKKAGTDGAFLPLSPADIAVAQLEQGESFSNGTIDHVLMGTDLTEGNRASLLDHIGRRLSSRPRAKSKATTIAVKVAEWVKTKKNRCAANKISAARCDGYEKDIKPFVSWIGAETDISEIGNGTVSGYYDLLCQKIIKGENSNATCKLRYMTFKNFVNWLWENVDGFQLPKNFKSKEYTFPDEDEGKNVVHFTPEEVRALMGDCSERTKLFMLLMLNCAMYQHDISQLQHEEVDWEEGRITRKRSKVRRRKNALTVCYKLWPETFALLKKFRTPGKTGLVLLSEQGNELTHYGIDKTTQKLVRWDSIAEAFKKPAERNKIKKSLKVFRKTSANRLENSGNKEFKACRPAFLAHKSRDLGELHYVIPPQPVLDAAIAWLRKDLLGV